MKNSLYLKNNSGVTLLALVITIIVILILATVGTYSGAEAIQNAKMTAFTTELKIMQANVNNLYDKWQNGDVKIDELGVDIPTGGNEYYNNLTNEEKTGYKYYTKEVIQDLGIEGIENDYIINIEKRKIISYEGLKYKDKMYYTLDDVPDSFYNIEYDKSKNVIPKVGDYIDYNVSYTDMNSNYEFTSQEGWRILETGTRNIDGTYSNVKIISTGIPANINYSTGISSEGKYPSWWGTDDQVRELYGEKYTKKKNDNSNEVEYPNHYASAGLIKKFDEVVLRYTKINDQQTGDLTGSVFLIADKAQEVHCLTLEELNKVRGLSKESKLSVQASDSGNGVFFLNSLYNEYGYKEPDTQDRGNPIYLLATPNDNNSDELLMIYNYTGNIKGQTNIVTGIRPVITLNSPIYKEKEDSFWKIK